MPSTSNASPLNSMYAIACWSSSSLLASVSRSTGVRGFDDCALTGVAERVAHAASARTAREGSFMRPTYPAGSITATRGRNARQGTLRALTATQPDRVERFPAFLRIVTHTIADLLGRYGYAIVALFLIAEGCGIPVPSATTLV